MSTKEKIIKLYKEFLTTEEFPIREKSNSYYKVTIPNANTAYYSKNVLANFSNNEYTYEFDPLSELNKKDEAKFDFDFIRGKRIDSKSKIVVITLNELPNITLSKVQNAKFKESDSFIIKRKNPFFRKRRIRRLTYEPQEIISIQFGSISHELTAEEFDELYDFCINQAKDRAKKIDEAKLDVQIERYTKK